MVGEHTHTSLFSVHVLTSLPPPHQYGELWNSTVLASEGVGGSSACNMQSGFSVNV